MDDESETQRKFSFSREFTIVAGSGCVRVFKPGQKICTMKWSPLSGLFALSNYDYDGMFLEEKQNLAKACLEAYLSHQNEMASNTVPGSWFETGGGST